ncbi:alpha/beta hydrolase [Candidatus Riflebacteria bacterium]
METRIQTFKIFSKYLKNVRTVHLYFSEPEIIGSGQNIPFIFLQDGQNLFDDLQNQRAKWGIEETVTSLRREGKIPNLLFIGIEHGVGRAHEYTPCHDKTQGTGGGIDLYLSFIIEELNPHIEKTFGIHPLEKKTTIGGSSLGGICSLQAWYKKPDFFYNFMVLSPSLWWADGMLIKMAEEIPLVFEDHKVWVDMGEWEWGPNALAEIRASFLDAGVPPEDIDEHMPHPLKDTRKLVEILVDKGLRCPENFYYYEDPTGYHNEDTWRRRFSDILLYFFAEKKKMLHTRMGLVTI